MRIYIAGPMSGLPESNYPAFHAAASAWRAKGWDVENPAEHFGGDQTRKYVEYVDADIAVLKTCDAIAMLPNWDAGHSGAIWERAVALHILGIVVYNAGYPVAPPNANEDPRGGEIMIADYDEYRAFQAWRGRRWRPDGNDLLHVASDTIAEWVNEVLPAPTTPITRNEQGVLGRHVCGAAGFNQMLGDVCRGCHE